MWIVVFIGAVQSSFSEKGDREDIRWIRKTKKGDARAFEKLVLKYQQQIYFVVRKLTGNHQDTDDIVQETFVKAYTRLHQFDDKQPFFPWLHRIAINNTINFQKQKANRDGESLEDHDVPTIDDSEIGNPLQHVMQDELKHHIGAAIEKLPIDQRTVFVLRTSEGLSYQEISEQLEISIGTVMSRLSRAREKLKAMLSPVLNDEMRGES